MSWLWSWLSSVLDYLGLSQKTGKIVFLGLDNAGKTTLLHLLKDGKIAQHVPTYYPTMEQLSLGGITFTTYDLGGHEQARRVWKDYFPAVDGVVFLVDAADPIRMNEARAELEGLMSEEMIEGVPILVLGNKIDKAFAMSEVQLKESLGVHRLCTGKGDCRTDFPSFRPIEVFMCSITGKMGYGDGFRWLSKHIQ